MSVTMTVRRLNSLAVIAFCLCLLPLASAGTNSPCPGPTAYYKGLGCTPVSASSGSACPERYDCSVVKSVPADKCLVNGRWYNVGVNLKAEDANPCDSDCTCVGGGSRAASFECSVVDCYREPISSNCYFKASPLDCCSGDAVCPEKPEDRPTCVVDGKTYKDGEHFKAPGEPDKTCVCQPGYKGENVEPFCATPNRPNNAPMFRDADKVHRDCAPVYYRDQSPATDYHFSYRCQNKNDAVIASSDNSKPTDPDMLCKFGNLKMRVGDQLNQGTSYSSDCVKCICEVPPVPTCQRLPDDECDVTKQSKFENF